VQIQSNDKETHMRLRAVVAIVIVLVMGCCLGAVAAQSGAPAATNTYAQKLVDEFTAKHVRLISMGIHAKAPNSSEYLIVAHTIKKNIGKKSEEEDLVTMRTGKPDGPNDLGGGIYDVIMPLHDASGQTIGAAVVHVKPGPGDPKAEAMKLALEYRDELAKQIPSNAKLFESTN
jgi:hypothetical protein